MSQASSVDLWCRRETSGPPGKGVKWHAGVLPQMGPYRTLGGMRSPVERRRARVAELRAAVMRAHPDHGGSTEALQAALLVLRAERQVPMPTPTVRLRAEPPRTSPQSRRAPGGQWPHRTLCGLLRTVFWVYVVALPLMLVLAVLVGRANLWILGG